MCAWDTSHFLFVWYKWKGNRNKLVIYLVQLTGFTDADKEALDLIVKAATIMDEIFYEQVE